MQLNILIYSQRHVSNVTNPMNNIEIHILKSTYCQIKSQQQRHQQHLTKLWLKMQLWVKLNFHVSSVSSDFSWEGRGDGKENFRVNQGELILRCQCSSSELPLTFLRFLGWKRKSVTKGSDVRKTAGPPPGGEAFPHALADTCRLRLGKTARWIWHSSELTWQQESET